MRMQCIKILQELIVESLYKAHFGTSKFTTTRCHPLQITYDPHLIVYYGDDGCAQVHADHKTTKKVETELDSRGWDALTLLPYYHCYHQCLQSP